MSEHEARLLGAPKVPYAYLVSVRITWRQSDSEWESTDTHVGTLDLSPSSGMTDVYRHVLDHVVESMRINAGLSEDLQLTKTTVYAFTVTRETTPDIDNARYTQEHARIFR